MAKDNTLNKNSLEFNIETGNKDQDKMIGSKAKNIKKSKIHNVVNNFNSNPSGLETLLNDMMKRIEKLEEENDNKKFNSHCKTFGDKDFIPYKLKKNNIDENIEKWLKNNDVNYKLSTDPDLMQKYAKTKASGNKKNLPQFYLLVMMMIIKLKKQLKKRNNSWIFLIHNLEKINHNKLKLGEVEWTI